MGIGKVHCGRKKSNVIPEGETACNTCRDGLCNASTRSVRLEATGCELLIPAESSAAIAARRCVTFHRRSAHACGCVPARWAATVLRAARRADRANRRERTSDPLVPVTPGRAVPASYPADSHSGRGNFQRNSFSMNRMGFSVYSVLNLLKLITWEAEKGGERPEEGGSSRSWGMGQSQSNYRKFMAQMT
jgi:hypothetical protein